MSTHQCSYTNLLPPSMTVSLPAGRLSRTLAGARIQTEHGKPTVMLPESSIIGLIVRAIGGCAAGRAPERQRGGERKVECWTKSDVREAGSVYVSRATHSG